MSYYVFNQKKDEEKLLKELEDKKTEHLLLQTRTNVEVDGCIFDNVMVHTASNSFILYYNAEVFKLLGTDSFRVYATKNVSFTTSNEGKWKLIYDDEGYYILSLVNGHIRVVKEILRSESYDEIVYLLDEYYYDIMDIKLNLKNTYESARDSDKLWYIMQTTHNAGNNFHLSVFGYWGDMFDVLSQLQATLAVYRYRKTKNFAVNTNTVHIYTYLNKKAKKGTGLSLCTRLTRNLGLSNLRSYLKNYTCSGFDCHFNEERDVLELRSSVGLNIDYHIGLQGKRY